MFTKITTLSALLLAASQTVVNAFPTADNPAEALDVLKRTYQPTCNPSCVDFIIGQKPSGGQVCVSFDDHDLIVTYPPVKGYSYDEAHLYLGSSPPDNHAPGQFPFNNYCHVDGYNGASCRVPRSSCPGGPDFCGKHFYIATHAALGKETGWGKGPCIRSSCNPWAMYFGTDCQCS